jgi:hypothetical protein
VSAHYEAGTSTSQTTVLRANEEVLSTPVSNKISGAGSYSIATEPTFLDYCQLPTA